MAVLFLFFSAGDVDPVVEAILFFKDKLVEVGVVLQQAEPMEGNLHVGVALSVHPGGVLGFGKGNVGCLA